MAREPFVKRTTRRVRETAGLASLLVTEPRSFPAELASALKRGFRTVWRARGGGLYACGFFIVFVGLEIRTFATEVMAADGIGSFFTEQLFEFIIRFSVQSIQNTVQAFIWPVHIIQLSPRWGWALLLAMYLVFSRFLKAPIETWLFGEEGSLKEGDSAD